MIVFRNSAISSFRPCFSIILSALLTACYHFPVSGQPPVSGFVNELRLLNNASLLPEYRTGSKVDLISTFDTTGGNDDGFSGKYSYIRKEGNFRVLADLKGPGVIHRIHSPTPTESMLAFYFDGEKTPRIRVPFKEFFSGKVYPFIKPLVGNEVGGYFSYVPIPYRKSLKIVYENDDIRFHQIEYRTYPTSAVVKSFEPLLTTEEKAELEKTANVWSNVGKRPWEINNGSEKTEVAELSFTLTAGGTAELFKLNEGGRIVGMEIDRNTESWGSDVRLEAYWDNESVAAIMSPADDFFGYSFGKPAAQSIVLGSFGSKNYCYLPMPWDKSARIALKASPKLNKPVSGTIRVYYSRRPRNEKSEGKFYAIWRRETSPENGKPYLLFDAEGKGHHVGTVLQSQGLEPGNTSFFEGDDVGIIDGERKMQGGGSEDYFNGGWYWILDRWDKGISLPIHGSLDYSLSHARTGGYRFYLSDKVPFEKSYHFTIEHGPEGNESPVDYTSVSFYYGNRPPAAQMNSFLFTAKPVVPKLHEFYPRDFQMELGPGTTAHFMGYGSQMQLSCSTPATPNFVDDADKGHVLTGKVRIGLNSLNSGKYKLYLSYEEGPESGEFSIWRRQQPVTDWINAFTSEKKNLTKVYLGDIALTDQIKTITIYIRAGKGSNMLRISRLIFEEID